MFILHKKALWNALLLIILSAPVLYFTTNPRIPKKCQRLDAATANKAMWNVGRMSIHISVVSQRRWHAWFKRSHLATPFHSVRFPSKYFWHASRGARFILFGISEGFNTWSCLLQDAILTSPVPVLYKEIKLWNHFFCGLFWSDYLNKCKKMILSCLTNWWQNLKKSLYIRSFVNIHTFYLWLNFISYIAFILVEFYMRFYFKSSDFHKLKYV